MSRSRLLFYNDALRHHMFVHEPPMRVEDARAAVDEVAGTSVDTLVYGLGSGATMLHNTEVGEAWGTRLATFKDLDPNSSSVPLWRAYENIASLKERGVDILELLAERAHEKGLLLIASLRMANDQAPDQTDSPFNSQFKIDHPEWCLRGRGSPNFSFVHPEVRTERLALIEEAVRKYELDGFELDWTNSPFFFEDGEIEIGTPLLSEYMREIWDAVMAAARTKTRPVALGARVLPTLDGNLGAGLDVPSWLSEGLVDFVVPNLTGRSRQMDADFPVEWLVGLAHSAGCEVFPALQPRVSGPDPRFGFESGSHPAGLENYWGAAAALWSKGADGIYLPGFRWPQGPDDRRLLSELADPDLLREKNKHYVVRREDEETSQLGYSAQLPVTLTPGTDQPGQKVKLFIADDVGRGEPTLRVRLANHTSNDSITVSLNGSALDSTTSRTSSHRFDYSWVEYPLPQGALRDGRNAVGVALQARPPRMEGELRLESVELTVTYRSPEAP